MKSIRFILLIEQPYARVKSRQKDRKLRLLLVVIILCVAYFSFGCSKDADKSQEISSATATTVTEKLESSATESSETSSTEPIERIFEECMDRSYINVLAGESNAIVFRDGHTITIEGKGSPNSVDYATNCDAVAVLMDIEEGVGRLYYSDGTMCVEISNDVAKYSISSDGSAVAYLKSPSENGIGTLYVYRCEDGESSLVSDSAGQHFALSPRGQKIAYTVFPNVQDTSNWEAHLFVSEAASVMFGKNLYPVALTDDASLVYAASVEIDPDGEILGNEFFVFHSFQTEFQQTTLSSSMVDTYLTRDLVFSADRTQVLFCDNDGIKFSESGKDAILLESGQRLFGGLPCKMNFITIRPYAPDLEPIDLSVYYSNTNQLYNVLMCINNRTDRFGNLWYFTEDYNSVVLTGPFLRHQLNGKSVLLNTRIDDQSILIYVEDIYSSQYETHYEPSDEFHLDVASGVDFVLSSDKNIYYVSDSEKHDVHYSTDTYSRTFHDANYSDSDVVLSDCVSINRYVRNNEPDLLFFCLIREPETESNTDQYVSAWYYDLYVMEDREGSVPELVAEKVGWVECGDFGVYYVQLDQVCPNFSGYSNGDDNPQGYDDQIKVFYSTDGSNFDHVADMEYRRFWGG